MAVRAKVVSDSVRRFSPDMAPKNTIGMPGPALGAKANSPVAPVAPRKKKKKSKGQAMAKQPYIPGQL